MLRFLKGFLLTMIVCNVSAQGSYVEPQHGQVQAQRENALEVLNKAQSLSKDKNFSDILDDQRSEINQIEKGSKPLGNANLESLVNGKNQIDINDLLSAGKKIGDPQRSDPIPLIMVSFSMTDNQIKALIDEAHSVGGNVLIRGLIDGDFKKTISKMRSLSSENGGGISIDPAAFKRYAITSVPAFVLPIEPVPLCMDNNCVAPEHIKASGSASLRYFLDMIERTGTKKEKAIASIWISKYRE